MCWKYLKISLAFMASGAARHLLLLLVVLLFAAACGRIGAKRYEYEEELYLALDGSATLNVNASVPALVALRGADLPLDPGVRLDREKVRALFSAPGVTPSVNTSRRDGRRFVHISLEVDRLERLAQVPALAWSAYRFDRGEDIVEYRQRIGPAAGKAVADVGWTGGEVVAFRMHVPSEIVFHNTPDRKQERGNILSWEQTLAARLNSEPLDLHVRMEPESILYTTLLLFGATIIAAALTFAGVLWWTARRARGAQLAGSHP
jgi:hypothetical protein